MQSIDYLKVWEFEQIHAGGGRGQTVRLRARVLNAEGWIQVPDEHRSQGSYR